MSRASLQLNQDRLLTFIMHQSKNNTLLFASHRIQDDLKLLSHAVSLVQKFGKYSPNVQYELGRALHLESFPASRVLLQQGLPKRNLCNLSFHISSPVNIILFNPSQFTTTLQLTLARHSTTFSLAPCT